MGRVAELAAILAEIKGLAPAKVDERFTDVFRHGCDLLELDDDDAAEVFGTSRPNASRWRRGKVVPPAARLVLGLLADQLDAKVRKLKRIEANNSEYATANR